MIDLPELQPNEYFIPGQHVYFVDSDGSALKLQQASNLHSKGHITKEVGQYTQGESNVH
jgi:hypothetical protein